MLEIAYYRSEHHYRLAYFLIDPLCIHLIGHLSRSSSIHVQFSVRDFLTEKYLCSRVHYGLTLTEIVSIKCFEKLAHKSAIFQAQIIYTELGILFFEVSSSWSQIRKKDSLVNFQSHSCITEHFQCSTQLQKRPRLLYMKSRN